MSRIGKSISATFAFTLVFMLSACNDKRTVVIKYHPLINTKQISPDFSGSTVPHSPHKEGQVFSVYCIDSIDNTDADALDFNFDVARLTVDAQDGEIENPFHVANSFTAKDTSVPAHTTATNLGRIVLLLNPPTPSPAWIRLKYKTGVQGASGKTESVVMTVEPEHPAPVTVDSLTKANLLLCPTEKAK